MLLATDMPLTLLMSINKNIQLKLVERGAKSNVSKFKPRYKTNYRKKCAESRFANSFEIKDISVLNILQLACFKLHVEYKDIFIPATLN